MITIRNGIWGARISETGAELKSLVALSSGQEYIWSGDPAWWNGSAPVLFPVIGGLKGGEYSYQGKTYTLPSHASGQMQNGALQPIAITRFRPATGVGPAGPAVPAGEKKPAKGAKRDAVE